MTIQKSQITGRQIAAGRVLAGMSQLDLAEAANISIATMRRIEASVGVPSGYPNNIAAVVAALEAAGIEFLVEEGLGVRLKRAADG